MLMWLTLSINKLYKPQTQGLNNNNTLTTLGIYNTSADAIDWLAEVNMPSDIQISYSVRAFLGEPDKDPKNWVNKATTSTFTQVNSNLALGHGQELCRPNRQFEFAKDG